MQKNKPLLGGLGIYLQVAAWPQNWASATSVSRMDHVSSQDGARQASILGTLRQALETEVLERQLTALEARLYEAEGV